MTLAQKTYDLYKALGILDGVKKVSGVWNHEKNNWEAWALYHDANGYRNARIAQFDDVNDLVEFKRAIQFGVA